MSTDPQFVEPEQHDGTAADPSRLQPESDHIGVVVDDSADVDPEDEYEAL